MFKTKFRVVTECEIGYQVESKSSPFDSWRPHLPIMRYSRLTDAIQAVDKLQDAENFKSVVVYEPK